MIDGRTEKCMTATCRERERERERERGGGPECLPTVGSFLIWANPGLLLFIFVLFLTSKFDYKWKKIRWCAWDLNLGAQDYRYRTIHRAMAIRFCKSLISVCEKKTACVPTYLPTYMMEKERYGQNLKNDASKKLMRNLSFFRSLFEAKNR